MKLKTLLRLGRKIRAIGFDDAPFNRHGNDSVYIAGVVCAETRFEGMVWGEIQQDGWDATDTICNLLTDGKFFIFSKNQPVRLEIIEYFDFVSAK
jgi:hypothetical protein